MIPATRQRSYLQSALYVIIVGALATVLLERLLTYAEVFERARMEVTLSRLQTGTYARVAYLALRGEHDKIDALRGGNPFAELDWQPPNYLGEFLVLPGDTSAAGNWYYDLSRREVVYVPSHARYLETKATDTPPKALRFRVEIRERSAHAYTGVVLTQVGGARWLPPP